MATRFELVVDHDKTFFQLVDKDGGVLLRSLGSTSKIMTQNEIQHLRRTLRDASHLVTHRGPDDHCFVVAKDQDGTVLARSPQVANEASLRELTNRVFAVYADAPIIDKTKRVLGAQGPH
jgi:hypothetical protein